MKLLIHFNVSFEKAYNNNKMEERSVLNERKLLTRKNCYFN